MTKISPELDEKVKTDPVLNVSADVSFAFNRFPTYKLGADNQVLEEPEQNDHGPSLKEVVENETSQLLEQHKRLSVRDLASRFDKNLAAAKLSDESKLREVPSLEGHVLLKKLRDALEALRGRLSGKHKEVVEKSISMVEALAVKLTQKEGELIQEKFEVKKLANFLKQASEDAKKLVSQEKSFACAEIESARAVILRIGEALEEQEKNPQASKKQRDLEGLIEEVQEARRIKVLHQPTKVIDMENEVHSLRTQILEKSAVSMKLQRELTISKRAKENKYKLFVLEGHESLGSYMQIRTCSDMAPHLLKCLIQWYRVSSEGSWKEIISGASKSVYAPEPLDVGRILQADISFNGQKVSLITASCIEAAAGLGTYVETLLLKSNCEFNVTISQLNGQNHPSRSVHILHVGKLRMKLSRGWITKAREIYSPTMQMCGIRDDSNNSAKSLFWQARKGFSFALTFETERDRNAAIMLARKYAFDCNVMLAGPDDIM